MSILNKIGLHKENLLIIMQMLLTLLIPLKAIIAKFGNILPDDIIENYISIPVNNIDDKITW